MPAFRDKSIILWATFSILMRRSMIYIRMLFNRIEKAEAFQKRNSRLGLKKILTFKLSKCCPIMFKIEILLNLKINLLRLKNDKVI
jgi:hypothetical protein